MPRKGINGRAIFVIDKNGAIQRIHEEAELKNHRTRPAPGGGSSATLGPP